MNLLPIYLDHILRPTIDDRAFHTEVAHVGGDGKWGGVVYSEMQSHEHTADSISVRTLYRLLYPQHGYSYETGGMLANLRNLTVEKVRDYHSKYYRWDNLCLTVSGRVDDASILAIIASVEDQHEKEEGRLLPSHPHPQPFTSPLPALLGGKIEKMFFPSDDESMGSVALAWRGPRNDDLISLCALDILSDYLSSSNEAPLVKLLVEDLLMCGSVSLDIDKFKECAIVLMCEDTQAQYIDTIGQKAIECLRVHRYGDQQNSGSSSSQFDLDRIKSIVNREKIRSVRSLEIDAHEDLADYVNSSFIAAQASDFSFGEILKKKLSFESTFDLLAEQGLDFWHSIFDSIFQLHQTEDEEEKQRRVEVRCVPCKEESARVQAFETALIEETKRKMGEDVLKVQGEMIERIKKELAEPPPTVVIDSVKAADVSKVDLLNVVANEKSLILNDAAPCVNFLSYPSAFIKTSLLLRLPFELSHDELSLLEILTSCLFECDVKNLQVDANGAVSSILCSSSSSPPSITPYSTITRLLTSYTSSTACGIGLEARDFHPGAIPQVLSVEFTSPSISQAEGVSTWLNALNVVSGCLKNIVFSSERVAKVIQQDLSFAKQSRRNGSFLLSSLDVHARRGKSHPGVVCGVVQQIHTLTEAKHDPAATALKMQALLDKILCFNGMKKEVDVLPEDKIGSARPCVFVSGDVAANSTQQSIMHALAACYSAPHSKVSPASVNTPRDALFISQKGPWAAITSSAEFDPQIGCGYVFAGSASCQSGYVLLASKARSPDDYKYGGSKEAPAHVMTEMISVMEGPLYKAVRGAGFAYGCDLYCRHEVGEFALSVSPASEVVKGLGAAVDVLKKFVDSAENGSDFMTHSQLISAKSSATYGIARREETYTEAAHSRIAHLLRGLDLDFNKHALSRIQKVEINDVRLVLIDGLAPLVSLLSLHEKGKGEKKGESAAMNDSMITLTGVVPEKQMDSITAGLNDWLQMKDLVAHLDSKTLHHMITGHVLTEEASNEEEEDEEDEDEEDEEDEDGEEDEEDGDEEEDEEKRSASSSSSKKRKFLE
eukprot:GDKJ01022152.1.p1 GENE.GDKJ01022152.1~~GDKJ01022152.1.p1  ORF type:complete len:1151 (+),score=335.84 GDKJ01022152.1:279-3455(+)